MCINKRYLIRVSFLILNIKVFVYCHSCIFGNNTLNFITILRKRKWAYFIIITAIIIRGNKYKQAINNPNCYLYLISYIVKLPDVHSVLSIIHYQPHFYVLCSPGASLEFSKSNICLRRFQYYAE